MTALRLRIAREEFCDEVKDVNRKVAVDAVEILSSQRMLSQC